MNSPWTVSIGFYVGEVFQHECTATLVARTIAISAAHCITTDSFDRYFLIYFTAEC